MNCIILQSLDVPWLRLRSALEQDLELLRIWKNKNKNSFFFKDEITEEMQKKWYQKYLLDNSGIMFMIEELVGEGDVNCIGCLGYRVGKENKVDLYNIIRGNESRIGGSIKTAMYILLSYLWNYYEDISCKVLNTNSALNWYYHVGFIKTAELDDYSVLEPDKNKIEKMDIQVSNYGGNKND